tara:strand:- start:690 stop:899 length:210 start_codon:yes stop_codon:yes gene_type:complete
MTEGAIIESYAVASTHDAESAVEFLLRFPNGGKSQVQVHESQIQPVLDRAKVRDVDSLIGLPWYVLNFS